MAYQQLTLRMIQTLVYLERQWTLSYVAGQGYFWTRPDKKQNSVLVHWATVLALCKRDLVRPLQTKTGPRYALTPQGKQYLLERSRQHDRDHA